MYLRGASSTQSSISSIYYSPTSNTLSWMSSYLTCSISNMIGLPGRCARVMSRHVSRSSMGRPFHSMKNLTVLTLRFIFLEVPMLILYSGQKFVAQDDRDEEWHNTKNEASHINQQDELRGKMLDGRLVASIRKLHACGWETMVSMLSVTSNKERAEVGVRITTKWGSRG